MLQSLLSTIGISLGMGTTLLVSRKVLRLPRHLSVDLGLTVAGAGTLFLLHLLSRDVFGFDPWFGYAFDIAKHGLEMIVILLILVAF